jgi:hypothetical protein
VVECNLAKVEVAGSNPVSRSMASKLPNFGSFFFVVARELWLVASFGGVVGII